MGLILMLLSLGAAAGAVARFARQAEARRGLAGAVRATIAAAPEGTRVHLIGTVDADDPLTAPISRRSCVYYGITVEEELGAAWQAVYADARAVPFVVSDGTGRALIDARGAEIEIDAGRRVGMLDRTSLAALGGDVAIRLHGNSALRGPRLRYREVAFCLGDTIAVIGTAVREPDPDAVAAVTGYREGPPTRLRLGRSADHALWLSDARDALPAVVDGTADGDPPRRPDER
ncbi:MAG: hypothetical protein IPL61_18230 [Myxococcales bacterium]|nr:hypothetical protein [Myxococcales bacterium]